MAINVSVQYNGGLLPDMILLTQCYYHRGTPLNAMKRFCINLQPIIPPKRFDIFPLTGGCSEGLGSRCVLIFLKNKQLGVGGVSKRLDGIKGCKYKTS